MSNRIAKILSTEKIKGRLLAKLLVLGKGDVKRVNNIVPFGLDSNIPAGYKAIYAETGTKEDKILLGIINEDVLTAVGATRLFSTDEAGKKVFYIHLKNDGTAEVGGNTDFMIRFNGLDGDLQAFITELNIELTTAFTALGGTWPGIALDISNAKIDKIKTL